MLAMHSVRSMLAALTNFTVSRSEPPDDDKYNEWNDVLGLGC